MPQAWKTATQEFIEAMADMGFRQNNGLACYDCGSDMWGPRPLRPTLCRPCSDERDKRKNNLPVGPAA